MTGIIETVSSWMQGVWDWTVHLNGMLQVMLVMLCLIASFACTFIARRMGMPSMTETTGGAAGRTVIIVVAWIGSVVFALVALFALAAVFAPLIGLATI